MKYNIIVRMFVFLFLTACNPDFKTNQKDVKYGSNKKELNLNQETKDSKESKISASRSRKSITDLSRKDIAVKIAVDNKEPGNELTSIGGSIAVPTEESSKSTRSTGGIEVTELSEPTKSQETSSIKNARGPEKIEQEPAKAEEEQKRKAAEEEQKRKAAEEEQKRKAAEEEQKRKAAEEEQKRKAAEEEQKRKAAEEEQKRKAAEEEQKRKAAEEEQKRKAAEEEQKRKAAEEEQKRKAAEEEQRQEEEEEKQAKDTIEMLTKKIDGINRDIDAIKQREDLSLQNAEGLIRSQEVINRITGPIYDHFTNGSNAIYHAWYDLDTDLEELLEKLSNTRSDLRAKLNEGNQKYTGIGNEPELKENVRVDEIESDLDKLKSELKGVKEYLKNDSNFEKIKENIANSDDE
ncbi:hypothetical protein [Borreliella tanukii]|uniref:hypothetical protein n=1 Tax=Borreliella tanukii TaxID=56146 RepID=UPI003AB92DBD